MLRVGRGFILGQEPGPPQLLPGVPLTPLQWPAPGGSPGSWSQGGTSRFTHTAQGSEGTRRIRYIVFIGFLSPGGTGLESHNASPLLSKHFNL